MRYLKPNTLEAFPRLNREGHGKQFIAGLRVAGVFGLGQLGPHVVELLPNMLPLSTGLPDLGPVLRGFRTTSGTDDF